MQIVEHPSGNLRVSYKHYRVNDTSMPPIHPLPEHRFVNRQETVVFRYHRGESKWKPSEKGGLTICEVRNGSDEVIATGEAECSLQDNFCYRLGREISRGRALKQLQAR